MLQSTSLTVTQMKTEKTASSTITITEATRETNVAPIVLISVITTISSEAKTLSQPLQPSSPMKSATA